MFTNKFNIWFLSSLLISLLVIIPILTVSFSFFEDTSRYFDILKKTFLFEYIFNSLSLLVGVLILTFFLGVGSAYVVSFYKFPGVNFFKWALILSFAIPPYIYAYSLFAFFDNYGTAFTILKTLFGDGEYNKDIPKFDGANLIDGVMYDDGNNIGIGDATPENKLDIEYGSAITLSLIHI